MFIDEKLLEKLFEGTRGNSVALMAIYYILFNLDEVSFYGVENFEIFIDVFKKFYKGRKESDFMRLIDSEQFKELFGKGKI